MHYVLVWWFKEKIQPTLRGYSGMAVYADDFVVCFQYKEDAEKFYEHLKRRIQSLGNFRYRVTRSLYKWLNRRSQKKSYSWEAFNNMLKECPLAVPKIYVSVYAR